MRLPYFIIIFILPTNIFAQNIITKIESLQSLYIQCFKDNRLLGSATGFIIKSKTQNYLITNYHVVTNKRPDNKQWLDTAVKISPNRIAIFQNDKIIGKTKVKWENLIDNNGNHTWYENTIGNEMVDVIELPLKDTNDIAIYPIDFTDCIDTSILFQPTNRIFVAGFPLALHSAPFFPIWKSGTIASEPYINQENKPIIWIDASTFPGMSGSPVYFVENDVIKRGVTPLVITNQFQYS